MSETRLTALRKKKNEMLGAIDRIIEKRLSEIEHQNQFLKGDISKSTRETLTTDVCEKANLLDNLLEMIPAGIEELISQSSKVADCQSNIHAKRESRREPQLNSSLLPHQVIPNKFEGFLVHEEGPGSLFVWKRSEASIYEQLGDELSRARKEPFDFEKIKYPALALALSKKYPGTFFRAEIKDVNIAEGRCTVFYLEWGNVENISFDAVFKMPPDLCHLPPGAIKVQLCYDGDVKKPLDSSKKTRNRLKKLLTGKRLRITVKEPATQVEPACVSISLSKGTVYQVLERSSESSKSDEVQVPRNPTTIQQYDGPEFELRQGQTGFDADKLRMFFEKSHFLTEDPLPDEDNVSLPPASPEESMITSVSRRYQTFK